LAVATDCWETDFMKELSVYLNCFCCRDSTAEDKLSSRA
jgi:hypothetical protein